MKEAVDHITKLKLEREHMILVFSVKDKWQHASDISSFHLKRLHAMNDIQFIKVCKEYSLDYKELLLKKKLLEKIK